MTHWMRKRNLLPALVFALAAGAGLGLVLLDGAARAGERRLVQQQLASNVASEIERRLSRALASTHVLAQEVIRSGGRLDDFERIAASTLERLDGIDSLQLAPGGVIDRMYPLAGNESAIGLDVLRAPRGREEALAALESRSLTLVGPFELVQGGIAAIGRNPVFLPVEGVPHADRFWGFTSALVMLDGLLEAAGLDALAGRGHGYRLGRFDPGTGRYDVFARGGEVDEGALAYTEVLVPGGAWTLAIGPSHVAAGAALGPILGPILGIVLALLVAACLAAWCRRVVDEPEQLRRRVAEQTRDLNALAYTDTLTGLANRNRFLLALEAALAAARTGGPPVALMLLDLDHFKNVNDVLGHDVGDRLLVEAGARMQGCMPPSALLSRLGGDEFTVIVRGEDPVEEARALAVRIIEAVEAPFRLGEHEAHVSASIGICASDRTVSSVSEILKSADQAMYEVKGNGRGGCAVFTEGMRAAIADEMRLVADLRLALRRGELELHYQPIVCAATGEVGKAEALLRWHHPVRGPVAPDVFVPLAEANGLIDAIGDWVFAEAAARVVRWQSMGVPGFQVSVNVSPVQFRLDDPVPDWLAAVAALGLRRDSLLVEITEGVLLGGRERLDALRAAGFEVALDDFGTGYSSLSYLKELDIDYLKIDKSFIRKLEPDSGDHALCRAIISLARRFGLKVVAEGVETDEQRELLCAERCDYLQGYLFSRPLEAAAFEARYIAPALSRAA